ncbi:MAG: sugar phosphate nucleotidyltransferase [Muribaculum sp.]|nr:sugar phosphate nucleotidyltransferase [Muribaculum sp.]
MKEISRHIIPGKENIREALSRLNSLSGGNMTLFAVDEEGKLCGSLTDGDIRRAITSGGSLDGTVASVCNRGCLRITSAQDRYPVSLRAKALGISLIPVVDESGYIRDIADMHRMKALLPIDAVLMAGGRGERLRPLTATTPKPLLKVGGRPIIDYNIEALVLHGVKSIHVTVNYLKEQITEHFERPATYGGASVKVNCVAEPFRLGTMGSLALVSGLTQGDVLVMNSDLLTNIDFAAMYEHHRNTGAELTMAVTPYSVNVPFAIVRHEGDRVTSLQEKPTYNYLANAGVYMMKRRVAEAIPKGEYLDAPDLVETLIGEGKRVGYYTIEGTWIDIGSPDDYRAADALMLK